MSFKSSCENLWNYWNFLKPLFLTTFGILFPICNLVDQQLFPTSKIAHNDIVNWLAAADYIKLTLIEGYFYHKTCPISFTLVVDDFLIKYHCDKGLEHLMTTLHQHYTIKCDTTANQYIGINLKRDYSNRTCILSMDGYVEQALCELEHLFPSKLYTSPSYCGTPSYSAKPKPQLATVDNSPLLPLSKIWYIQQVLVSFYFMSMSLI